MWWPYVSEAADVPEVCWVHWVGAMWIFNVQWCFPDTKLVWKRLLTPWLQLLIPAVNSSLSLLGFAWLATGKMVYHSKFIVALTMAFWRIAVRQWGGTVETKKCCELLWWWAAGFVYSWWEECWGQRKVFDRGTCACQFNMLFLAGGWVLLTFESCCGVGNWQPSKCRDVQVIFLVPGFTHVYSYGFKTHSVMPFWGHF